jgi:hypothetical protein
MTDQVEIPEIIVAFRELGPRATDVARAAAANQRYCSLLLKFAKRHCAYLPTYGLSGDPLLTAIHTVLTRLWTSGPRGVRQGDPTTEPRLSYWFRFCVANELRSMARKEGRHTNHAIEALTEAPPSGDDRRGLWDVPVDGRMSQDYLYTIEEHRHRAEIALWPAIVKRAEELHLPRYRDDFRKNLHLLEHVSRGVVTVADAAIELTTGGNPDDRKAMRVALDTRFKRVREKVIDSAKALVESGDFDPEDWPLIEWLVATRLYLNETDL